MLESIIDGFEQSNGIQTTGVRREEALCLSNLRDGWITVLTSARAAGRSGRRAGTWSAKLRYRRSTGFEVQIPAQCRSAHRPPVRAHVIGRQVGRGGEGHA